MPRNDKRSLLDMIDHQKNGIVSKTLIDREAGSVTLTAFDRGQGFGERTVPFDALVVVLEGEVDISIRGSSEHLSQEDSRLIPAGEPHSLKAASAAKALLIAVKS
ncbi:cupin domain-containing protein [Niveibacterium terrae]|uniref:cupin domain-containing protein n=1 Tax=Niveibacterium terrae TaxID=3373598 RepID=UPI003A91E721